MKNVPTKIYIQIGQIPEDEISDLDFNELHGVTWSSVRINQTDLKYTLNA